MKCNVDVVRIRENSIQLNGWAIGKTPETEITYQVEDGAHQPIRFQYVATRRDDVSQIYFGRTVEKELGFDIQFPYERGKDYYLIAKGEGRKIRIKYNEELIRKRSSVAHKRMQKIRDLMNMETVRVCLDFWKENGLKALLVKSKHKLQGIDNDYDYGEWYSLTKPTAEELEEQRKKVFDAPVKFSIVIPAFKTPERFLREMLDSIAEQTYANWEVCVADGSPAGQSCERVLEQYAKKDSRFKYVILGENKGISGNTNAAMDMATGDYIVLADHDDKLTPNALYECAKLLQEHPGCDCFYSDEDKLDMDGGALFDPHFKPDFNPDLLTSVNYICHLFVVKRTLLEQVGGFRIGQHAGRHDTVAAGISEIAHRQVIEGGRPFSAVERESEDAVRTGAVHRMDEVAAGEPFGADDFARLHVEFADCDLARIVIANPVERIRRRRRAVGNGDPAERHGFAAAEKLHLGRTRRIAAGSEERDARLGAGGHYAPDAVGVAFADRRVGQGPRDAQHDVVAGFESFGRNGHLVAGGERPRLGGHHHVGYERDSFAVVRTACAEESSEQQQKQVFLHRRKSVVIPRRRGGVGPEYDRFAFDVKIRFNALISK